MPCTVSQNEDILPLIMVGERFSSSVVSLAGTLDYPIGQAGFFVILSELPALFLFASAHTVRKFSCTFVKLCLVAVDFVRWGP